MRQQFTFYRSYSEEINSFKKKADRLKMFEAICEYALIGKEPIGLTKKQQSAFERMRIQLDCDSRSPMEVRRSGEYKDWRNAVFQRDNYTCQMCGARGVKINAHHIKQFAFYPEQRTELSNGITLCVSCHKAVHHGS